MNTLTDIMSRLIEFDTYVCQDSEHKGQEYGYCVFEQLPVVPTLQKMPPKDNTFINETDVPPTNSVVDFHLNITHEGDTPITAEGSILKG